MLEGKLDANGKARLQWNGEEAELSAADMDRLMQTLCGLRASMPEPVADRQAQVDAVFFNPLYTVRLDKETKACLLSLRHPGFGWINFELPTQEVLNMRTLWNHVVDRMELEPPASLYEGPERRRSKPH